MEEVMGLNDKISSVAEGLRSVGRKNDALALEGVLEYYQKEGTLAPNHINLLHKVGIRV